MIALANGRESEFEGMSSTPHFRHSSKVVRCLPVPGFRDPPLPKPVSHILETIYGSQLPPVFHKHNGIFGGTRYPLSLDAHSGCIYNPATHISSNVLWLPALSRWLPSVAFLALSWLAQSSFPAALEP